MGLRISVLQAGTSLPSRVTVTRDGGSRVLAAVDDTAGAFGLRPGMKLAQARILVPDLLPHEADPAGDAATLLQMAEECLRYAPLAAPDPPDGLWIDVTGSTHLHGGESRLLRDLVRRLARRGFPARAAVADTPAMAHAVARFGGEPTWVVPPAATPVSDFPIEALRLPPETLRSLRQLGFERVGPLAAAARAPLVRRFGATLALRLDQLAGRVFEPIVPIVPAALIQARLAFVEPLLTAEAFASVIARLVPDICGALETAGQGARRLDLLFERVDGTTQAIRIGTAAAIRDARHLGRMLTERLEQVDPGPGVETMRLVVAVADPLGFIQTGPLIDPALPPAGWPANPGRGMPHPRPLSDITPLVDLLANRLGEARVYRLAPVESHVPERSVRRVTAMTAFKPAAHPPAWPADPHTAWPADQPRPVRLLTPPQPVEALALLPDAAPVAFVWRRVRHRVRHADGPDRIAGEWWKHPRERRAVRDYFRVEDEDGRRFWLFRHGDGNDRETGDMRWFLHGFF